MGETVNLYASENIHLYACARTERRDTLLVTFANWEPTQVLVKVGFGHAFAEKEALDSLWFTCASNAWWQYADMPQALAVARRYVADWRTVVTYGGSMGGYGALRFAAALGAKRAIAAAPQYSVDPVKVPFENRYDKDVAAIQFQDEGPIQAST